MRLNVNFLNLKFLIITFGLVFSHYSFSESSLNSPLEAAYKDEFIFLQSQKKSLTKLQKEMSGRLNSDVRKLQGIVSSNEARIINLNDILKNKLDSLEESRKKYDSFEEDLNQLDNIVTQGYELKLHSVSNILDATQEKKEEVLLSSLYKFHNKLFDAQSLTLKTIPVLDESGKVSNTNVIKIGEVATVIDNNEKGYAMLAPAKMGYFKVLSNSKKSISKWLGGDSKTNSSLFLFDSPKKEYSPISKRTFVDEIKSSGFIGYVIVILGAISLLCLLFRILLLSFLSFGSNISLKQILESDSKLPGALNNLKLKFKAAKNNHYAADEIDNIYFTEEKRFNTLSSMLLLTATIAPLLGLLGTVTGMIATFQMITEFGSGNPKMLSGGISEALLTTKLGLVVAIPCLFAGNLLNRWSNELKDKIYMYVENFKEINLND